MQENQCPQGQDGSKSSGRSWGIIGGHKFFNHFSHFGQKIKTSFFPGFYRKEKNHFLVFINPVDQAGDRKNQNSSVRASCWIAPFPE